jgi:hypothetical protein
MYLLFPSGETGQVAMVLPSEGGLKSRNIQTFDLESQALRTQLNQSTEVPIAQRALISIPSVEYAFYEPIKTAKELAVLLAEAAREIEQVIPAACQAEDGHLRRLPEDVRPRLLKSLATKDEKSDDYGFSDMYAQTIVCSLFTARIFGYLKDAREGREKETLFYRRSAWEFLPKTNPFLRNIFKDISAEKTTLPDELVSVINRVFNILRAVQIQVILSDFQSKGNREDLVIRFYEDFLAAYNPGMREKRGVYYTPESVVGNIVPSVDHILKTNFGLKDGLADTSKVAVEQADGSTKDIHKVLITDVAVGTGVTTFFIDRCLSSKGVVAALRQTGITIEIHDDHFPNNTADVDWLPKVGESGWVVLTKDANIARRTLEKIAVTRANVQLFIVTAQQLASTDMIAILIKAIASMQQFVHNHPAPFIAKIYRDSRLEMWRDREALLKELDNGRGHSRKFDS